MSAGYGWASRSRASASVSELSSLASFHRASVDAAARSMSGGRPSGGERVRCFLQLGAPAPGARCGLGDVLGLGQVRAGPSEGDLDEFLVDAVLARDPERKRRQDPRRLLETRVRQLQRGGLPNLRA